MTRKHRIAGALWFSGKKTSSDPGPKDLAKAHACAHGHKIMVQMQCPVSGVRRFGSYPDLDTARVAIEAGFRQEARHAFEIIRHGMPCKPYGDIDSGETPLPTATDVISMFNEVILLIFQEDFRAPIRTEDIKWTHSPKPDKLSLHFVVATHNPQLLFRSNHYTDPHSAYFLAERIVERRPDLQKFLDLRVYTADREMRLAGATKYGQESSLAPVDHLAVPLFLDNPFAPQDYVVTHMEEPHAFIQVPERVPNVVINKRQFPRRIEQIYEERLDYQGSNNVIFRIGEILEAAGLDGMDHVRGPDSYDLIEKVVMLIKGVDDRDVWIRVAFGLFNYTQGAPEGFKIFERWSAQSLKFPGGHGCLDAWKSATRGPGVRRVGAGTLFRFAKMDAPEAFKKIDFNIHETFLRPTPGTFLCVNGAQHRDPKSCLCTVDASGGVFAKCLAETCSDHRPKRVGDFYQTPPLWKEVSTAIDLRFLCIKDDPLRMSESKDLDAALSSWLGGTAPRALGIRSAMGTGKSSLLDTVILKMPRTATMLAVTFRQTLALELSRKLKNHGFVSYKDVAPEESMDSRDELPRVICQIESLHRLKSAFGDTPAFDLVVVDEMESALRHLGGSPTVKSPFATTELLSAMMNKAGRVLTLDAYLGDTALSFAKAIGMDQRLIHNVHRTQQRTFEMTSDIFEWKKQIVDDVLCGGNIVVASLSATLIEEVHAWLLSCHLPIDQILKNTAKSDGKTKAALIDVEKCMEDKRVWLYSPTVNAGVDHSSERFDRIYLYLCPGSCPPMGAVQMSGRVRKVADPVVRVAVKGIPLDRKVSRRPMTQDEAYRFLRWVDDSIREEELGGSDKITQDARIISDQISVGACAIPASTRLPAPTTSLLLRSWYRAEKYNAEHRYMEEFTALVREGGHKVTTAVKKVEKNVVYELLQDMAKMLSDECGTGKEIVIEKILKAESTLKLVVDTDAFTNVYKRICADEATENERYGYQAALYKAGWGLSRLSKRFLEVHGPGALQSDAVRLARRIVFSVGANKDVELDEDAKHDMIKAPFISSIVDALGLQSIFDCETTFDLMDKVPALKELPCFKETGPNGYESYDVYSRLFRGEGKKYPVDWTKRKVVTSVINMCFSRLGLKVSSESNQKGGVVKGDRVYTYTLDDDQKKGTKLRWLFCLRARGIHASRYVQQHAAKVMAEEDMGPWGNLVDPRPAWPFI